MDKNIISYIASRTITQDRFFFFKFMHFPDSAKLDGILQEVTSKFPVRLNMIRKQVNSGLERPEIPFVWAFH